MKLDDTENLEEMARLFMNGNTRELELEGFEVVPDYYEEKKPRIRCTDQSEDALESDFEDDDEYDDEYEEEPEYLDEDDDEYEEEPEYLDEDDDEYEEEPEYLDEDDDEYEEEPENLNNEEGEDYDYEVTEEEITEAIEQDEGISDDEYEKDDEPDYEISEDIRAEIDEMDDEEAEDSGVIGKIMIAVGAVAIIVLGLVTMWFLYSKGIIFKKDKPAPDIVAGETVIDDVLDTVTETAPEPETDIEPDTSAQDPEPTDRVAEEDLSKDYGEADYENSVEIGLETVSVLKDLKVKFINNQTGKLIANIPFEIEVSFPDGSSDTWSDSDKDGIIYHDGLTKGSYTIKTREIKDEKYSSYKMPASKVAEVKGEIAYTAINVADEVLASSQVDENAEDTVRGGADTGGETQIITAPVILTDTVAYVDSSATDVYVEVDISQVNYTPSTSADPGITPVYSISPETGYTEVTVGSVKEILITLEGVGASGVTVSSSNDGVATVGLSPEAKLTITGVSPGTASVTVTVNEKPEVFAQIDVKVVAEGETGGESTGGENGNGTDSGNGTGNNDNSGSGDDGTSNGSTQTEVLSQKMKFIDGTQVYVLENGVYREAVNGDFTNFSQFFRRKTKYTGWQTIDGGKYFYTSEGNAVTGDQVISGVKYSFDSTGKLVSEGGGNQSTVTGDGTLGIDVSKWNGNIDWTKVKNAGISYAIIRVGYRGSSKGSLIDDSMFKTNIAGATAAGVKVGVYFFSQAVNEVEAVEEASMVIDRISGYGLSLPVYLDVEKSGGRGDNIDKNMRTAVCKAFCQTISNAGYRAGVYSNKNWLTEKINTGELTGYSIWVAHYNDTCGYTGSYSMWQYTDKGSVDGISGNVDLDRSYF